ncbi:MAG TPA: histidine kinase N-terminal 7TM domain-containing protein [Clostridia bacterium]|nr:histidine kinase N-terminal 7TM domain-containing protein [Clostridia bacterium]
MSTTLSLISSLLSFAIFFYFLIKVKKSSMLYSFLFYMFTVFLWPLPNVIHKTLTGFGINNVIPHFLGCMGVQNLTICFTGTAWLIFCLHYTSSKISQNKRLVPVLILLSVIYFIFAMFRRWTYYSHNETVKDVFLFTTVILLTYMVAGIAVLLNYAATKKGNIRKQAVLLVFAIFIPLILIMIEAYTNMEYQGLYKTVFVYLIHINSAAAGFTVSSLIITFATFKYRFMDIVPVALQKAFQSMQEGILVIDISGRMLNCNSSFNRTFGRYADTRKYYGFGEFISKLKPDTAGDKLTLELLDAIQNNPETKHTGELYINKPVPRCFSVNADPVSLKNGEIVGSILTFYDVTDYKNLLAELDSKCSELGSANRQLMEYTLVVGELAAVKERNRVTRDIHDSIGHSMTMLVYLLEAFNITVEVEPGSVRRKIGQMLDIARNGLEQVDYSTKGLSAIEQSTGSLTDKIKQMISGFEHLGIRIDFSVYGQECENLGKSNAEAIYRVCQEAFTNSFRHGKAKNITVILKFSDEMIKLYIVDDGTGCKDIKKGFGLSGMEGRVNDLKGSLAYGSSDECGFNIHVEIPIN